MAITDEVLCRGTDHRISRPRSRRRGSEHVRWSTSGHTLDSVCGYRLWTCIARAQWAASRTRTASLFGGIGTLVANGAPRSGPRRSVTAGGSGEPGSAPRRLPYACHRETMLSMGRVEVSVSANQQRRHSVAAWSWHSCSRVARGRKNGGAVSPTQIVDSYRRFDSLRWETAVLKAHGHKPAWTRGHSLAATSREAFRART